MPARAGCCTQWLIYDAYAADQQAQRRAESDTNKRSAAARKGAAATHSAGDARDSSAAEASAGMVRAGVKLARSPGLARVQKSVVGKDTPTAASVLPETAVQQLG